MIAIVDYDMGNLHSVQKGLERVGVPARVTGDAEEVRRAEGLVLPGVGAFRKAMNNLEERGLVRPILDFIASGKAFLGICLGLQLLFTESEEFGRQQGLGVFAGRVARFPFPAPGSTGGDHSLKVPHMGWNAVHLRQNTPLLAGIAEGTHFYFVHSYYPVPEEPSIAATTTEYGMEFVSSVARGKLFACQFHPEKSQSAGLGILRNFGRLVYA